MLGARAGLLAWLGMAWIFSPTVSQSGHDGCDVDARHPGTDHLLSGISAGSRLHHQVSPLVSDLLSPSCL